MIFFIPARKNSTRIPGKNMMLLAGKPLIQWTMEAVSAFNSPSNKVLISSDDENILNEAKKFRFEYSRRPDKLCSNKTTMLNVLEYYLPFFKDENICILYPTSPLRKTKHIVSAKFQWDALASDNMTLMSVTKVMDRPYGLMSITDKNLLKCNHAYGELFYQEQSMPESYRANGAIYIIPAKMIREKKINSQLFCKETIPFVMDQVSGHEIDNPIDIKIAESLMGGDPIPSGKGPYVSTTLGKNIGAPVYVLNQ